MPSHQRLNVRQNFADVVLVLLCLLLVLDEGLSEDIHAVEIHLLV